MTTRARNIILFWTFLFAYFLVSATFVGCGPEELPYSRNTAWINHQYYHPGTSMLDYSKKDAEMMYDAESALIARWRAAAKVVWIVWGVLVVGGILATPTFLLNKSKVSVVMEDGKQYPFFGWVLLRELGAAIIANFIVHRKKDK